MALINVPDINNLDAATPELFNSRFGVIANEINGNLSAANLADGAVTAGKLGTSAVTTGKINDAAVTPTKWTNPYKFKARASSNQAVNDATTTKITFGAEDYDSNSNFASSTYTVPVDGYYNVQAKVQFSTSNGVGYTIYVYKNGSSLVENGITPYPAASTFGPTTVQINEDLQLLAGDTLEVYAYCDTGNGSQWNAIGHATKSLTSFGVKLNTLT